MDYSLKSLRDAFEDAEYKCSKREYELYAILLATSLDHNFVLEYLSFFHELDELTGEKVLVIGPQLAPTPANDRNTDASHLISSYQLKRVREIIRHASSKHIATESKSTLAADQFLAFMQEQTRESYAIARYLGISTNSMPQLVFLDNLDSPLDRVEWSLQHKRGREFVYEFRKLLTTVSDECGWNLQHQLNQLDERAKALKRDYFSPRDVPYELRQEWETCRNAKEEFAQASRLTAYFQKITDLRVAYDRARNDPELRIPLKSIGETIAKLETGLINENLFVYLHKHYRRWKNRMPMEYKEALERFPHPFFISTHLYSIHRGSQLTLMPEDAAREKHRLDENSRRLENIYKAKKGELSAGAEELLGNAKENVARPKPPPLRIIQRELGNAATSISNPSAPLAFRESIRNTPGRMPTVFVSYSHDSPQHATRVLEIAQRLRSEGVDCWIDQFEQGPSEGFPRWMVQQINRADKVLLVCSETYRRRFDGLEERGKGLGANFEGYLILQELLDSGMRHRKFIPVLLPESTREHIPTALRGAESFDIPEAYYQLLDRIFEVGGVEPQPLGRAITQPWSF